MDLSYFQVDMAIAYQKEKCGDVDRDVVIIKCSLPPGITIGDTSFGKGIFAAKNFSKGDVLWVGRYRNIEDTGVDRKVRLITSMGEYQMTTEMHTVGVTRNSKPVRQIYSFDGFMNHSCSPNTYSADHGNDDDDGGSYDTVALTDINEGDEISCDYCMFDLDCTDKAIDNCCCGSPECRGEIRGFHFLPLQKQYEYLGFINQEDAENWAKIHPEIMYRVLKAPENGFIQHDERDDSICLIANKKIYQDEIAYEYDSEIFDTSIVKRLITVVHVDQTISKSGQNNLMKRKKMLRKNLEFLIYTVNVGGTKRQFFQFDTFCDHSCDPNLDTTVPVDKPTYQILKATRDIEEGEKFTCDYTTFDEGLDGTVFNCECGAIHCMKVIRG